jgi:hypothetical protein
MSRNEVEAQRSSKLGFGRELTLELFASDPAPIEWVSEFLGPALVPAQAPPDWQITLSPDARAYEEELSRRSGDGEMRACFAFDQEVLAVPVWEGNSNLTAHDARRSCFVRVRPGAIELIGNSASRRWRSTLVLLLHELVAARLRSTDLELHAAAVGTEDGAVAIVGPKGAGKTTLSFNLLRPGLSRAIANDRVFVGIRSGAPAVRGVPTAVKIRPPTLTEFPELRSGIPPLERPYLYTVAELVAAGENGDAPDGELFLSPAQVAHQLGVERAGSMEIACLAFPEVDPAASGCGIERLEPDDVRSRIVDNYYGRASGRHQATLFEEIEGGRGVPPPALADELSRVLPGWRVVLGRDAYAEPDFGERLLDRLCG